MKISSKSILSPGHHHNRDPPSSAATRRLKTNRSLRGAQSPMPRGGRPFENPEPSSPKVTCIGQVKIKTRKKQGNCNNRNLQKTLSRNRTDLSFRGVDKNQRWVHFPVTICEALSCLFPCRTPSCLSGGEREKGERETGCAAVFARWLVAEREIEEERGRGFRRHGVGEIEVELKEEEGRVSICVPPKNALLLMRCRSDPLRVNALANRLWECPITAEEDNDDDDEEDETVLKGKDLIFMREFVVNEKLAYEDEVNVGTAIETCKETEDLKDEISDINGEIGEEEGEKLVEREGEEGFVGEMSDFSSGSVDKTEELEMKKTEESIIGETKEVEIEKTEELEVEFGETEQIEIEKTEDYLIEKKEESEIWGKDELVIEEEEEDDDDALVGGGERRNSRYSCSSVISLHLDIAERETEDEPQLEEETEEEERETKERETEPMLPDCLLLMRCEPKLSMEVSKETWICSTDFIRWLPQRRPKPNKINVSNKPKKRLQNNPTATDAPPPQQPPRSSCSYPAPAPPASMAALIEQRLMSAAAYEPFVLTRCKSEPMRTAAAKLVPESCFWNNHKLEPHRSANFGVSAAGVGF